MPNDKKIILVIEDELPLIEAIRAKLTKSGFEVITARSIEQAKNHMQDIAGIDVIWLDHYLLGKGDGLDFIAWCKTDSTCCKKIPVFVVSNTAGSDKVQSYLRLGVEKYYVKSEKRLGAIIKDIKLYLSNTKRE